MVLHDATVRKAGDIKDTKTFLGGGGFGCLVFCLYISNSEKWHQQIFISLLSVDIVR